MILALWIAIGILYFLLGMSILNKNELRKEIAKLQSDLSSFKKFVTPFYKMFVWHHNDSAKEANTWKLEATSFQWQRKPGTLFINEKTGKIEVYTETPSETKFVDVGTKKK